MIETFAWFGLCCAVVIALAITALIVSFLFLLIERSTMRWFPLFRIIHHFYQSLPRFTKDYRYYLTLYDREKARFICTEALTSDYQNEEEYRHTRDEFRERLRKKSEVSE